LIDKEGRHWREKSASQELEEAASGIARKDHWIVEEKGIHSSMSIKSGLGLKRGRGLLQGGGSEQETGSSYRAREGIAGLAAARKTLRQRIGPPAAEVPFRRRRASGG